MTNFVGQVFFDFGFPFEQFLFHGLDTLGMIRRYILLLRQIGIEIPTSISKPPWICRPVGRSESSAYARSSVMGGAASEASVVTRASTYFAEVMIQSRPANGPKNAASAV